MNTPSQAQQPKRPYQPPRVKTLGATTAPVLLACTGRFDCEPLVGYACCAQDDQCEGC